MALASGIEHKIGVQHHHAHIASCMAENHLRGKVLGVALDGTGFGTDGRIWGGEFLLADFTGFTRRAHLRNVLLPGGDAAVRQPWRMALSYLRDAFGQQMPTDLQLLPGIEERQVALVDTMLARQIQTVETSSCGRLFDAVAALLGLASEVTLRGPGRYCARGGGRAGDRRALRLRDRGWRADDPRLPAGDRGDRERSLPGPASGGNFRAVFTTR